MRKVQVLHGQMCALAMRCAPGFGRAAKYIGILNSKYQKTKVESV